MNSKNVQQTSKEEKEKYDRWVRYLSGSNLTPKQVHERALKLAKLGREPN